MRAVLAAGVLAVACAPSLAHAQPVWNDHSGTVTLGATSQVAIPANGQRHAILVQNPCAATESLFIDWGAAASTSNGQSVELQKCQIYESSGAPSQQVVNVTAATTGHAFTAKERQ